jgi:hypothetical protein
MKDLNIFGLSHCERWMWAGIVYMVSCPIIAVVLAVYRWWLAS